MKFHPDTCPECGLSWTRTYGPRDVSGYEQLAAHVWKCRRCGETVVGGGAETPRIVG